MTTNDMEPSIIVYISYSLLLLLLLHQLTNNQPLPFTHHPRTLSHTHSLVDFPDSLLHRIWRIDDSICSAVALRSLVLVPLFCSTEYIVHRTSPAFYKSRAWELLHRAVRSFPSHAQYKQQRIDRAHSYIHSFSCWCTALQEQSTGFDID